ncbi:uncharacterized protein LOC134697541 [Mytilus trossulus]|uniref:uncharacterized protein LOC134697541 n=1 Tax=Mytilus trossulus TaxID=6551 RepID=UPI003004D807
MKKQELLCDHKTGCIQGSSNISTEPVSSPSTVSTIIAAFTSESVWFTTEIQTENGVEDDNIHSTIYTSSSFEKKETTTSMSTKKGLLEREIVIYSLSAAVLVLFILLCTACQQRYQKVYGNLKKYQTSKRRRRNIQENPLPEIPLEDIEGVYDVIDELNMINDFENVMDSNFSSESETNGGYVQPDNNGYLTPYQPVDEDSNTSNINDIKSVSLQTPNANGDAISDHVSITSSSGVHGRKCSNINTNRPLDHPVDTQDYISTHSSDLETISRESGYLNPYQPMIPATDLHEYKYVIGFSDGSGSSLSETSTKEIGAYISNPYQDLTSEIDTHDYI